MCVLLDMKRFLDPKPKQRFPTHKTDTEKRQKLAISRLIIFLLLFNVYCLFYWFKND